MPTLRSWPEAVASAALSAYAALPERGKPRCEEWTVLAAFVVEDTTATACSKTRFRAVALGTGNKCVGRAALATAAAAGVAGGLLHDSHAEVLARRALLKLFYDELKLHLGHSGANATSTNDLLLEEVDEHDNKRVDQKSEAALLENIANQSDSCSTLSPHSETEALGDNFQRKFRLRQGLRLHLYVSEAPCGDAALFEVEGGSLNFTGAKLVEGTPSTITETMSTTTTAAPAGGRCGDLQESLNTSRSSDLPSTSASSLDLGVREPEGQVLGAARLKSGRSDLRDSDRTLSMSCSDKLTRWGLLGLQGSLLSLWLRKPLPLASVVVSKDPRAASPGAFAHALQRAIPDRVAKAQARAIAARAVADRSVSEDAEMSAAGADTATIKPGKRRIAPLAFKVEVLTVHVVDASFEASMQSRLAAAAAATLSTATAAPTTDESSTNTQPTTAPPVVATTTASAMPAKRNDSTEPSVGQGLQAETASGVDDGGIRPKKRRKQEQKQPSMARPVPSGLCINWVATMPLRAVPSKQSRKSPLPPVAATSGVETGTSGVSEVDASLEIEILAGDVEVTVGASGRRQGAATKGPSATAPATRSRLCKERLFAQWRAGVAAEERSGVESLPSVSDLPASPSVVGSSEVPAKTNYLACKEACGHGRCALVSGSAPLIPRWVCTPIEYDSFDIT